MRLIGLLTLSVFLMSFANGASAQDTQPATPPANLPALDANTMGEDILTSDEPLRLSPDGPAVIKLDEDAASVIIGNPAHATAVMENPRLLMVMPALPGATKIMALNREGKAIFNRHVLVDGGKGGFKRITRVCATSQATTCQPVSMYYCPDKCYETAVTQPGAQTGATGDVANPVSDTPENPAAPEADAVDESLSVIQ